MVAGAGSGKTTSLVKALATCVSAHGEALTSRRQRIACITYTEVAASEIWADVGNNPLVHVSTIHSFLWAVSRTFQADICKWVARRTDEKAGELRQAAADFGPRIQQRTRDRNARDITKLEQTRSSLREVREFRYGTGSDYAKGTLGHDDVIRMATDLLRERPLFRTLLAQRFPFVFVDESQDTQEAVVAALKSVAGQAGPAFCLGFFGDPMQKIYGTGIGPVIAEEGWTSIEKEENFRCPASVLAVANAIRRDGDDLVQTRGRTEMFGGEPHLVAGTARMFILPADGRRDALLARVRDFVAKENGDPEWRDGGTGVKTLVVVHRMAASRLGFADVYAALNDGAPAAFSDGFLDGTAWPLRPFLTFAMPMVEAVEAGREFEAMTLLRRHSPMLARGADVNRGLPDRLRGLRAASRRLSDLLAPSSQATIRDVLVLMRDECLAVLDPRVLAHLEDRDSTAVWRTSDETDEASREISSMDAFLVCPAAQLRGYNSYIRRLSPFSTHQGIKGTEFRRVLVVLDDEEGTHAQFSYDKYFGVKPPSRTDVENTRNGKGTSMERTRRLFYVCCTRATDDLVVVYFAADTGLAEMRVRSSDIFLGSAIYNQDSISI